MTELSRRITAEELGGLKNAFLWCQGWSYDDGVWSASHGDWTFLLSDANGAAEGHVFNSETGLEVELPEKVAAAWLKRLRVAS